MLVENAWAALVGFAYHVFSFECNAKRFAIAIFFFPFPYSLFLDGLAEGVCQCLNFRYPRRVRPVSDLFPWTHWQMFSSLFCLLLFQVWMASACLIGIYLFSMSNQLRRGYAWNISLLCELYCCKKSFIAIYSSYNW